MAQVALGVGAAASALGVDQGLLKAAGHCIPGLDAATGKDKKDYGWLHKASFIAGVVTAAYIMVWGVMSYGPTPAYLIGSLVAGLVVFIIGQLIACSLEGKPPLNCMISGAEAMAVSAFSQLTGLPVGKLRSNVIAAGDQFGKALCGGGGK